MLFKKILCFFIFAVIAGLFTACDSAGTDYPYGPVSQGNIEALVLNEGGINQNMGGISVLNKDGSVIPDIFREVNHRPLGDVAQSITKINGKYFVTLDNSKKIEVIDPETFGWYNPLYPSGISTPDRSHFPDRSYRIRSGETTGAYPDCGTLWRTSGIYLHTAIGRISGNGR